MYEQHNIKYHCYANDIHIYTTLKRYDKFINISSIEDYIAYISNWINKDKTECTIFTSR